MTECADKGALLRKTGRCGPADKTERHAIIPPYSRLSIIRELIKAIRVNSGKSIGASVIHDKWLR